MVSWKSSNFRPFSPLALLSWGLPDLTAPPPSAFPVVSISDTWNSGTCRFWHIWKIGPNFGLCFFWESDGLVTYFDNALGNSKKGLKLCFGELDKLLKMNENYKYLHAWQAFLLRLLISHAFDTGQVYSMFPEAFIINILILIAAITISISVSPWIVLLKKALQASQEETP